MTKPNHGTFRTKQIPFTQVPNTIVRDKNVSLKAKGLYQLIQSYITIPNFVVTKPFLLKQCNDGEKSFNSAWRELKETGYLKQYKYRNKTERGFTYEYELLDVASPDLKEPDNSQDPQKGSLDVDHQKVDIQNVDFQKRTDINTDKNNTYSINTILSNQSNTIEEISVQSKDSIRKDRISEKEQKENIEFLTDNINPDLLAEVYPNKKEEIKEIFNLICETVNSSKDFIVVSKENKTIREIQNCFFKLEQRHIEYILNSLDRNTSKIKNPKAYLLATIYNSYYTCANSQNFDFNNQFKDDLYMSNLRLGSQSSMF